MGGRIWKTTGSTNTMVLIPSGNQCMRNRRPWEKSRQPLAEQPRTAAKNQAAESGRDSMKWIGIRINTADSLRNGRRPDISRKKTIRPNIGRKRIIRTNTDRTDTSSKPDITGTNTGRR